ncbi:MAG TPA: nucleotidyl transferase AbiEii/AbiGii toxin family protein [Candidatus Hydrogenedentes bacterium]|nr:nucleotidyl transferase AbiEii/AbiGii toxin family protein [Candidatus Hydrogenedentota bacterium]
MNEAVEQMLARFPRETAEDHVNALREVLQQIALLGLWRAKFFEHAAFYGGTALRVLHGLDRYSEDLDFSLLAPDPAFTLGGYGDALRRELASFGFEVDFEARPRREDSAIASAFLRANTLRQMIVIRPGEGGAGGIHAREILKIKLEVDTDPPPGFATESRTVLLPVPFAVRVYTLPDLFAGKMHALLCRKWGGRVKGRDWHDFVWYAARHPRLHLSHLEARMRSSGHWTGDTLTPDAFHGLFRDTVDALNVKQARDEVRPFVRDPDTLALWSREFFLEIAERVALV